MEFEIKHWFSPESQINEWDSRNLAVALGRLGYFTPDPKIGMAPFDPDYALFDSLRRFQSDQGLFGSGTIRPGDETVATLNDAMKAQEQTSERYIWRSVHDDKTRATHAARSGREFSWNTPPGGGHPGEDYNCRCWAEPVRIAYKPPITKDKKTLYPDAIKSTLGPLDLLLGGIVLRNTEGSLQLAFKIIQKIYKPNTSQNSKKLTGHGKIRVDQRRITPAEIQEAIKTSRKSGNIVTKIGKYGTPQDIYKGSNGITVVMETSGRNAGKIITLWRE